MPFGATMKNEEHLRKTAVNVAEIFEVAGWNAAASLSRYFVSEGMYEQLKYYIADELKSRGYKVEIH
jgi:hypothetical protein